MNSLEKLISNLSTYWDIEPEKVVDRLNNMNESELKEIVNKMTKKYKTGGILDCLAKGGSLPECGCGAKMVKKGEKGLKDLDTKKTRRTDAAGDAWREKDGSAVLSRDAQGVRILPGSSYAYGESTPPMRTVMRVKTDEGGRPVRWDFDVWNDNGDNNFSPVYRYSSERTLDPRRKQLTPEALQKYLKAYRENGLYKKGGCLPKKTKYPKTKK